MRQLRQVNSGTAYAEKEKIEKCEEIVYKVRQTVPKEPVFGVNFINLDTTLLDSDLNQDPSLRKSLEAIGTVSTQGNSGIVHLDIKRVVYAPLWVWGAVYFVMGCINIVWLYVLADQIYDYVHLFHFIYLSRNN